ncbi:hypothetical protein L1049_024669 [Liquidambar formosana]|uniref:Uncharacterized protein n=1 Tax=Liquidambar formosana TaxID=63359 RepID=A0AAP0X5B0_LIQFO
MVSSASMAVQDQSGGAHSSTLLSTGDQISLNPGPHSVTRVQLKEQFYSMDDNAPKVRKPYTITKQRERWTEDEHKKFIEALKLYGRAWRRIEEHVGSKTAVQIRSHAQKFFSKVVRESSGSNTSSVEPIEIPPPRPKRKPMHPYPRKVVDALKKRTLVPEQPISSASPNSSISEQENQSPMSVLSAFGSDMLGSADSNHPNGSSSPVSSAAGVNPGGLLLSESNPSAEENGSLSPVLVTADMVEDEQVPVKLELCPSDNDIAKEGLAEQASIRSLKLFGRTVLVTDSHMPSSPTMVTCKSLPEDMNEGRPVQTLPWSFMPTGFPLQNTECPWSNLPHGAPGGFYYMHFQDENPNLVEGGSATPLPCWTFYGGIPFPCLPFRNPESEKANSDSNFGVVQNGEIQKEGSWTGSNTGSVNEGENGDKNWDIETQSRRLSFDMDEKEPHLVSQVKPSEKSGFSEQRANSERCMKGFVPYKRCLAERDTQSSTVTGEEREEQRIRLCL